jgi:hypothetical protein
MMPLATIVLAQLTVDVLISKNPTIKSKTYTLRIKQTVGWSATEKK